MGGEAVHRLDYKKANDQHRAPRFAAPMKHLESLPELQLADYQRTDGPEPSE